MKKNLKSTIILLIIVVVIFAVRWPLDDHISNVKTWGANRPPLGAGTTFFTSVFRGGGGTPAIFAMLGGQRYMVANILWQYSEILFHRGRLFEMVAPLDAVVTLNPAFADAWSVYGWHLAWNIYAYTDDPVQKRKWMEAGTNVYIRAIKENPNNPNFRFDLAWLLKEREGNLRKALNLLEPVVFPRAGDPVFKPRSLEVLARINKENEEIARKMAEAHEHDENCDHDDDDGHNHDDFSSDDSWIPTNQWDPNTIGRLLAIVYRNAAVATGDFSYLEKAIKTYRLLAEINPYDSRSLLIADALEGRLGDKEWMRQQQEENAKIRRNFQLPAIQYNQPLDVIFPDGNPGIEGLVIHN